MIITTLVAAAVTTAKLVTVLKVTAAAAGLAATGAAAVSRSASNHSDPASDKAAAKRCRRVADTVAATAGFVNTAAGIASAFADKTSADEEKTFRMDAGESPLRTSPATGRIPAPEVFRDTKLREYHPDEVVPELREYHPEAAVPKLHPITRIGDQPLIDAPFDMSKRLFRRTDEQARSAPLDWPRDHAVPIDVHVAPLREAACGGNLPGVYILRLHGRVMKVGSAESGVRMRMQQYYSGNPSCGLPQITAANRDKVEVTWQDCPVSKCNELESKLARKYGLGPWAQRTPHSVDDTWELLI